VLALIGIASFLKTPLYDAVGRISVAREHSDALRLKVGVVDCSGDNAEYNMYLEAQVNILQSNTRVVQVARDLHWLDLEDHSGSAQTPELPDAKREAAMIGLIQSSLDVSRVPRTPIIEIRYSDHDPRSAAPRDCLSAARGLARY